MKSIFELDRENGKKLYHDGWNLKSCEQFSEADCKLIKTAVVENGDYGLQVRFFFNQGGSMFYGVSKNAEGLNAQGEVVDPKNLYWVTLSAVGQQDIRKISDHQEE